MSNNSVSWMAAVADDTLLSQLMLPGTHDTAALHGGPTPECQNRPLLQQLQIGIRLLDIQLCYVKSLKGGENFALHHGPIYQWAYFDREFDYSNNPDCREFVLQDCISFLQDNPTECIVMSIDQAESDLSGPAFNDLFRKIITKNQRDAYFYNLDSDDVPALSEHVRGKIVVVNRMQPGLGIYWGRWNKQLLWQDSGSRAPDVEDHYQEVIESHKWRYVKTHLDKASNPPPYLPGTTWFVTYTSNAGGLPPLAYANYINPLLYEYFTSVDLDQLIGLSYGSIFMDFPNTHRVSQIRQIAQRAFPANPLQTATTTTPWLYDQYEGKISVAHSEGQDNRVTFPTQATNKVTTPWLYDGYSGHISVAHNDGQNNRVVLPSLGSISKLEDGWVSHDFGSTSYVATGDIDGIQFAYQGGYGIVNARVHLRDKGDIWEKWLTNVMPTSSDFVTDAFTAADGIRWIGAWRQDRYGIVDAQCCYATPQTDPDPHRQDHHHPVLYDLWVGYPFCSAVNQFVTLFLYKQKAI